MTASGPGVDDPGSSRGNVPSAASGEGSHNHVNVLSKVLFMAKKKREDFV